MVIHRVFDRIGWAIAGALGIALIAVVAGVVRAGPLDPPGPPASTAGVLRPGTPIDHIPYTISAPGNYYVTQNLTLPANDSGYSGIVINASNVTLDLGGFYLDGAGIGANGVMTENGTQHDGITIRNGTAQHWTQRGFWAQYVSSAHIEDVQSTYNHDGIVIDSGTLDRCTASWNTAVGVNAAFATVSDCGAHVNQTGFQLYSSVVTNAVAEANTGDGIVANTSTTVRGCNALQNGGSGVNAYFSTVQGCSVYANHYGILVQNSNIQDNTVATSNSDGIRVVGFGVGYPGDSFISGNTVDDPGGSVTASGIYVETNNNRIVRNTVSGSSGPGIYVVGSFNTIDDNSTLTNTGIGIVVNGSKNTVVRNSSLGNVNTASSTNYSIGTGNNPGPVNAANSSSDPWSNTQ